MVALCGDGPVLVGWSGAGKGRVFLFGGRWRSRVGDRPVAPTGFLPISSRLPLRIFPPGRRPVSMRVVHNVQQFSI